MDTVDPSDLRSLSKRLRLLYLACPNDGLDASPRKNLLVPRKRAVMCICAGFWANELQETIYPIPHEALHPRSRNGVRDRLVSSLVTKKIPGRSQINIVGWWIYIQVFLWVVPTSIVHFYFPLDPFLFLVFHHRSARIHIHLDSYL